MTAFLPCDPPLGERPLQKALHAFPVGGRHADEHHEFFQAQTLWVQREDRQDEFLGRSGPALAETPQLTQAE